MVNQNKVFTIFQGDFWFHVDHVSPFHAPDQHIRDRNDDANGAECSGVVEKQPRIATVSV